MPISKYHTKRKKQQLKWVLTETAEVEYWTWEKRLLSKEEEEEAKPLSEGIDSHCVGGTYGSSNFNFSNNEPKLVSTSIGIKNWNSDNFASDFTRVLWDDCTGKINGVWEFWTIWTLWVFDYYYYYYYYCNGICDELICRESRKYEGQREGKKERWKERNFFFRGAGGVGGDSLYLFPSNFENKSFF